MSLTLYNTLTRSKAAFHPRDPNNVRMYVCGPTVYDFAHIGNARPIIVFDLLFRLLRHVYGDAHVTYARNITDVDDKINARAVERYPEMDPIAAIKRLTTETTEQFHRDIATLGVLPPTVEPRATDHIEGMRQLCDALVAKGNAYVAEDHVLFHVPSMPDYGRLSGRSVDDMLAGARVDVAPYKRDPMDFVLWKPSPEGVPAWPSPCGIAAPGRPGWHLECSAMAEKHLGKTFDIHGGGIDLSFPHHENEIAQSRCAHGTSVMAEVWMHNGFLQVEGEKMSKSLGNFITINELLQKRMGEDIRWQMLKTHYRQPIDWTEHAGNVSKLDLIKFGRVFSRETWQPVNPRHLDKRFIAALYDDLNTPAAISVLHSLADEISRPTSDLGDDRADTIDALHNGLVLLGFPEFATFETRRIEFHNQRAKISVQKIENHIAARIAARKARNFGEADRIRAELDEMGIQVMDTKNPATGEIETTWEVKR